MREHVGLVAAGVYVLGLCAVHSHLMRYGVTEIAPIQLGYMIVGSQLLISLAPSLTVIVLVEGWMSGKLSVRQLLGAGTGSAVLVLLLLVLGWRLELTVHVLNLIAYPYPRWYLALNLFWGNALLLSTWVLILIAARLKLLPPFRARPYLLALPVLGYAVLFGRTVWPAIDRAAGGAAPECVELEGPTAPVKALLVHQSPTAFYVLQVDAFPDTLATSSRLVPLTYRGAGPIRNALENNRVLVLPCASITRLTYVNLSQHQTLRRYLDEGRHLFPQ